MRLQRFLGHADPRSTDAYVVLGAREVKDLVRGQRPHGMTQRVTEAEK